MARKRKAKIAFTEKELMLFHWILSNIKNIKTKKDKKLFEMSEEEQKLFEEIRFMIFHTLYHEFPPSPEELYEITGGYLSEGVYVTPDGNFYSN